MTQRVLTPFTFAIFFYRSSRIILNQSGRKLNRFIRRLQLPICALLITASAIVQAQTADQSGSSENQNAARNTTGIANSSKPSAHGSVADDAKKTFQGFVSDQKRIWTAPAHLKISDAEWLVPTAGIATGLFMTDPTTSHELTRNSHVDTAAKFSDVGLGLFAAASGTMYVAGRHFNDDHLRESGLLSAEAAADTFVVTDALKYSLRRERPDVDRGQGAFFQSGGTSFPSGHASTSFAIATVIAHEYPGAFSQFASYGLASAVSLARVDGQKHFPSDVFIGGTIGYLIGRSVYKNHHDPDVDYGTFERASLPIPAERMSSTYIELDSWIYPAVERLAALNVIDSTFAGIRPWTRMAVYAMVSRAEEPPQGTEARILLNALRSEFHREAELRGGEQNQAISIDRVYTRTQYISGPSLNDGFHFGQTIVDDFGRPFGEGLQQITGFESRAEAGRFSFFVRGEYQHAPPVPGYSTQVNQTLAKIDLLPGESFNGVPEQNVFRLLDTYASFNLLSNEISVGKQTYWWGPDDSTSLMLSDNAAPFYGIRLNRTFPLYVPLFSKLFGTVRYDNFFGRLYGNRYPPDPFTFGQKLILQPTKNLEIGFSRSSIFAGKGLEPLTLGTFWKTATSASSGTNVGFNPRFTPGTRHANFDIRYRLPFLRNWVTAYIDSFVHDDISPADAPNRAAVMPGIYVSHLPGLPKMDLHVEGGTTDTFPTQVLGGNFYYYEGLYQDSYTINRNLLGSWIGREGTGGKTWINYWLNPASSITAGFRTVKVSQFFIPQGETQQDAYVAFKYRWQNGLGVELMMQHERWVAPLLASVPQSNFTTQIQLSFWPKDWKLQKR